MKGKEKEKETGICRRVSDKVERGRRRKETYMDGYRDMRKTDSPTRPRPRGYNRR
jgi:hypothetical protein